MSELSAEPVRLVIWDLDETFWQGTLSEGGIAFCPENRDIVIALAERGIISTICSKNDFETVRDVLKTHDVWDYFIFPSVNWEPKGPRLQALIDTIQLRPETVMLIDDNPMNRNEALFFVPGMQVADETVIPELLSNPLFKGNDDRALTRLKQYKLLEKRKADEIAAGGSNVEFLRSSNIRIQIEHDIESHVERVIELVNRTNQLNFTKRRLPEDRAAAAAAVKRLAGAFDVQTGLIRVRDNYGDYGFCGFFCHAELPRRRKSADALLLLMPDPEHGGRGVRLSDPEPARLDDQWRGSVRPGRRRRGRLDRPDRRAGTGWRARAAFTALFPARRLRSRGDRSLRQDGSVGGRRRIQPRPEWHPYPAGPFSPDPLRDRRRSG